MRHASKQIVDYYGLHKETNGVHWLIEQGSGKNAIGLPNKQCPFRIKTNLLMCPHSFNLDVKDNDYLSKYEKLLRQSEILKFLDPIEKLDFKCLYVETSNPADYHSIMVMQYLLNMNVGCANGSSYLKENMDTVFRRLKSSNLSSYFIYDMDLKHSHLITNLLTGLMASKGKLIIAGPKLPLFDISNFCQRIVFEPAVGVFAREAGEDNVRAIGSLRLKKKMRT